MPHHDDCRWPATIKAESALDSAAAAQVRLQMGVAGGSWAYSVTAFNQIWMLAAYILFTGRASVVWGLKPTAAALKVIQW